MSELVLEDAGGGRIHVRGPLTFDTVGKALADSQAMFAGHGSIELDFRGVETTDSAGLALLVEWAGWAHRERRKIRFQHLPAQVHALARISEVDKLLPVA